MIELEKKELSKRSSSEIEVLVDKLIKQLTISEKIGQMYQSGHQYTVITGPIFNASKTVENIRKGMVGSILGMNEPEMIYNLQKVAVEESRMKIPLLFCNDIIHGCRTIFPHNLALSCSFNPKLVKEVSKIAAYESAHCGINLTFSPMLDLVRDPRWGRVMESCGEDPFLLEEYAKAYVEGYQQDDLTKYDSIASCAKHFIGYGAASGGKEYNSVDMSDRTLRQYYLPPFKQAINSGVKMIMTAFNTFNDVPVTANKYLLTDILRNELKFNGVTISDYTSSGEIIKHKIAVNNKDVALKCLLAGLDHEMISTSYVEELEGLLEENPALENNINQSVKRILTLKYELGLFDNPYKNIYQNHQKYLLSEKALNVAYEAACQSIVLLKNENNILPINNQKIALIGPFIDNNNLNGAWGGQGKNSDCETLYEVFKNKNIHVEYSQGTTDEYFEMPTDNVDLDLINEAVEIVKDSDIVIMACGENQHMSGEGYSRTNIELPNNQIKLINAISETKKKIILLVYAGRPLDISKVIDKCEAVLYTWFLGTRTSRAIVDTVLGINNPNAKLTMTFPRTVGQIPIYYNQLNTGRPYDKNNHGDRYKSRYVDIINEPMFPFGYGLSYAKFIYGELKLNQSNANKIDIITVSTVITNESKYDGYEVVQLYIEAMCFTVSRPNMELKKFQKIYLKANSSQTVVFELKYEDFKYYNIDNMNITEPGKYLIKLGTSSVDYKQVEIVLI